MDARDLIDDLAEVLVVPSFTRTGFRLRRRLHAWPEAESYSMAGRTVVLTGPTSGLGRAAAGAFARMGARLVLVGRDAGRLERTRYELVVKTPGVSASTVVADMASVASVRAAAGEILTREPRLDVIVDNAGMMLPTREVTDEGFERTFATMVLGPFVFVARLLPHFVESADARLVAVTSGGMYTQSLPLDDLGYARGPYNRASRVRPSETRPGRDVPRVSPPPARHGCRREHHAPGVGRDPRARSLAARLREARRRSAAEPWGGRGHDALAGGRSGCPSPYRSAVPRPPGPTVRPHPEDTPVRGEPGGALGCGPRAPCSH